MIRVALLLLSFTAIIALQCSSSNSLSYNTGGSEVVGKLVTVSKNPVVNAQVFAYRVFTDTSRKSLTSDTIPWDTVISNEKGEYTFENLDTGLFNFYGTAHNGKDSLYFFHNNVHNDYKAPKNQPVHRVDIGTDTMRVPGWITGKVILEPGDSSRIFCFVPGSSFIAITDKTGAYTISNVPPGTYQLYYWDVSGRYSSADTSGIMVVSGNPTIVAERVLQLSTTGTPPAPKNVIASYDTVSGKVSLSWDKVNVADLQGYVVFRLDNGSGLFVPITTVNKPDTFSNDLVYTDPADTSDHSYSYEVKSQDIGGDQSDHSDIVTITAVSPSKLRTFVSLTAGNSSIDTAAVLDKIPIIAHFMNKFTLVRKLYWSIGTPDSVVDSTIFSSQTGADTLQCSWKQAGVKTVYVRSLDDAGRSWTDSINITIVQDNPVINYLSPDTTIDYGGMVQCSLSVTHLFGACSLFVDVNHDGKFDIQRKALSFDTILNANANTAWGKFKIRITDNHGNKIDTGFTVNIRPAPPHDYWDTCLPMPTARKLLSVCVINKTLYAIGGCKRQYDGIKYSFKAVNTLEAFTDSTWTTKKAMDTARYEFVSAVYGNSIYVFGGQGLRAPAQTIERYDTLSNTWTTIGTMPFVRIGAASCVVGNKMYLFGGRIPMGSDDSVCNGIYSYDFSSNQWSGEIQQMNTPRYGFQAILSNGHVYLLGGYGGSHYKSESQAIADVEIFDPNSNQCVVTGPMPSPRFNFAAVVVHDSLFVIGGVDDQDNILNDIITYYPNEGVWKNKTNFPPQHQEGRHSLSAGVLNGKIITVGGGTGLLVTDIGSVDNLVRRYYP